VISERDPRVYFAAERTMLAWIRTGLAMMGFGFVVARFGLFLRELTAGTGERWTSQGGVSLWAGTSLVLLGVLLNVYAAVMHVRFSRRFHAGEREPHDPRFAVAVGGLIALMGCGLAVYLIVRGA
jgi:putative membrane protein